MTITGVRPRPTRGIRPTTGRRAFLDAIGVTA